MELIPEIKKKIGIDTKLDDIEMMWLATDTNNTPVQYREEILKFNTNSIKSLKNIRIEVEKGITTLNLGHNLSVDDVKLDRFPVSYGGFGAIYVGYYGGLKIAAKHLYNAYSMDEFQNEVKLMCQLRHPHCILCIGYVLENKLIVMEWIGGGDLESLIRKNINDLKLKKRICEEIIIGLSYLHSKGVVHRDLKPANILLTEFNQVKITDFGLSKNFMPLY